MRILLLTIAIICGFDSPSWAEAISGADDPAFRAPFERALQGDDATALREIQAAAENGNEAALRALPSLLNWMPPQGTFAERKRFRAINGVPLEKAVAAVSPVAAAWSSGRTSDAGALDARAKKLVDAGETGKAHALYREWLSRTGLLLPISLKTAVPPPPLYLFTAMLVDRLTYGDDPADGHFLAELLRNDRPEGWLTMGALFFGRPSTPPQPGFLTAEQIIASAEIDPFVAGTKMTNAREIIVWNQEWVGKRDPEKAGTAAAFLRGRPEFAPVEAFCRATCPDTAAACEAAWLFLSSPYEINSDASVPEVALISTDAFFATPRGARLIFPPATIGFYAKSGVLEKVLAPAATLDSCLADAARTAVAATGSPSP